MFERLDLAESLGIWRHAKGRVVGVDDRDGHAPTVDVDFPGYPPLVGYLPHLFRASR